MDPALSSDHSRLEHSVEHSRPQTPVIDAPEDSMPTGNLETLVSADIVDLRQLEYTSPVDRNLVCPICRCPFVGPVRLPCDHIFCQDCIQETFENQSSESRHCPSCRTATGEDQVLPVSRAVVQMVNELEVRCPNAAQGCLKPLLREDVEDHIRKYCQYAEVSCGGEGCGLTVQKRDYDRPCLHKIVRCGYCNHEVMEKDLDHHVSEVCERFIVDCPACGIQTVHHNLSSHISDCSEVVVPCTGSPYGCPYAAKRADISTHITSCPIAALSPYLQEQSARLDLQARTIAHLQRKNDLLESSLSSVQTVLGTADSLPPILSATTSNATAAVPNPPFDNTTHHLLSLHESLREELDRVTAAVQELDARSSLMVMNESLRTKEDLAHTNAALNSMRVQLHWLMSARLQTHPARPSPAAAASGSAGPASRVGAAGAGMPPLRRLSDSTRQDTKL